MSLYVISTCALLVLCAFFVVLIAVTQKQWMAHLIHKEAEWQAERKDLLDRIQAPSFAEYTNKVIKEKKAEQPEEKQEPVEFVS